MSGLWARAINANNVHETIIMPNPEAMKLPILCILLLFCSSDSEAFNHLLELLLGQDGHA